MKRFTSPLALALLVTLSASGMADDKTKTAKPDTEPATTTTDSKTKKVEPKTITGTHSIAKPVIVDEIITFGPVHYFYHSRDFYKNGDMKAAARELNKAASMMDLAVSWDKGGMTKERLAKAAKDLKAVAAGLEKGETISLKQLETAVAQAHVALSWHHFHAQGSNLQDIEGRDVNMAGHHLVAAGRYMESAAKWAGKSLGTETVETVHNLDIFGDKLITVDSYRITSAEPTIQKFAQELEKLGAEIESGAKLQKN